MIKPRFSKAFTFSMLPEHFELIKQITDNQQTSMAQWVRRAVEMMLNNTKREEDE